MRLQIFFVIAIALTLVFAHRSDDENITEVPFQEAIDRIVNGEKMEFISADYRNADGLPLTDEESRLLNEGKLSRKFYQNNKHEIIEIRCGIMEQVDTIQEHILTAILGRNPLNSIEQPSIDCHQNTMAYLHNRVFPEATLPLARDTLEYFRFNDIEDLDLLVSIIEQCGFPTTKEKVKVAYEVLLYYYSLEMIGYYYHEFLNAHNRNFLSTAQLKDIQDKLKRKKKFSKSYKGSTPSRAEFIKSLEEQLEQTKDSLERINLANFIKQMEEAEAKTVLGELEKN